MDREVGNCNMLVEWIRVKHHRYRMIRCKDVEQFNRKMYNAVQRELVGYNGLGRL